MLAKDVNLMEFFFSLCEMVDSEDDLSRCLNVFLVDSNLDEVRCVKFMCSNASIERDVISSETDSAVSSDEEGCDDFRCGVEKVVT